MQAQPSAGAEDIPTVDEVAELVLELLLERHPGLVAIEELLQDLADPYVARPVPPPFVEDAIDALLRAGLAHQIERFLFATYPAVRARQLQR